MLTFSISMVIAIQDMNIDFHSFTLFLSLSLSVSITHDLFLTFTNTRLSLIVHPYIRFLIFASLTLSDSFHAWLRNNPLRAGQVTLWLPLPCQRVTNCKGALASDLAMF